MFEGILIALIIYTCMYMPLRGKSIDQLSQKQLQRVEKSFAGYKNTKKGKQTPEMTIEEYLPIIQKQALTALIATIGMAIIYVFVIMLVYA